MAEAIIVPDIGTLDPQQADYVQVLDEGMRQVQESLRQQLKSGKA